MAALPQPWKALSDRIYRVEKAVQRLINASPFSGTGLSVPQDGVTQVDGSLIVGSGEAKSGNYAPATAGWHLGADGKAEFKDITLYDLPNSMLANPVTPGVVNSVATNFGVSAGSWSSVVSFSATVPANCTQLLALATGMAFVVNPNTAGGSNGAGGDVIECRIGIGGTFGMAAGVSISGSNGQTSCPAAVAVLLTGLTPGGTITLVTQAATGYQGFAANGANQANLCAQLIWLR